MATAAGWLAVLGVLVSSVTQHHRANIHRVVGTQTVVLRDIYKKWLLVAIKSCPGEHRTPFIVVSLLLSPVLILRYSLSSVGEFMHRLADRPRHIMHKLCLPLHHTCGKVANWCNFLSLRLMGDGDFLEDQQWRWGAARRATNHRKRRRTIRWNGRSSSSRHGPTITRLPCGGVEFDQKFAVLFINQGTVTSRLVCPLLLWSTINFHFLCSSN